MPKVSRRTKINRIVCRRTKLDRRICPICGVEVTQWDRNKIQRCFSCRKHFAWHSAQKVLTSRARGKPTLKYSGRGSPAMSTIEERSEAGDGHPRPSSGSSPIDDDDDDDDDGEHTPDHDSPGRWITAGRQGDHSVDGNGNAAAASASLATDREDGTVVGEAVVDLEPARDTESTPPEDWRCSLSIWEIINKNNAAQLYTTTVPVVDLNQQSITALPPATAVPELVPDASCPTSPHPTPPRTTSPCPSFPRQIPKKKICRFRERFQRKRAEPMEPRPSLEDIISIPEVVPRQRAAELLNTLVLARHTHSRGTSTEPTTASPTIVPQEPDTILQQHATNLHDALVRLEALEVACDSEEASVFSRKRPFWSRLACFL